MSATGRARPSNTAKASFITTAATYRLVDLPGTYSLTANSPEEVIAREFILREKPDVVVAVVSAANLERSLYLVSELICLPAPLVVALNMMDVAEQEGIHVEPEVLQAALGVPVDPHDRHARRWGARTAGRSGALPGGRARTWCRTCPRSAPITARRWMRSSSQISGYVPAPYPTDWVALKLLEGDAEMTRRMQAALPAGTLGGRPRHPGAAR